MNCSDFIYGQATSTASRCGIISYFTFAGKEKDLETGLSYFGARYSTSFRDVSWQRPQASLGALLLKRYYDADLTTGWLSVDPMADKYPSMSPYNYCAGNPVRLVDPDGREIDEYEFNSTSGELKLVKKTNADIDIIEFDDGSVQNFAKGILNGANEGDDISTIGFNVTDCRLMPEAIRLAVKLSRKCHKEIAFSGHGSQMQDIKGVSVLPWSQSTCDQFSGNVKLKDLVFLAHIHPGCVGDDTKGYGIPSSTDFDLLDKLPGVAEFIISNDGLSNFKRKENDPNPTIPKLLNCWMTNHSYKSYPKDKYDEK